MPLPKIIKFSQVGVHVDLGPFAFWVVPFHSVVQQYRPIAVQGRGLDLITTGEHPALKSVTGSRFVDPVPADDFEDAWHDVTDKYLFPKRVGKLKADYAFSDEMPLGILADWLEERGQVTAAIVLRNFEAGVFQLGDPPGPISGVGR